jgi:hypothetical protein
MVVRWGRRGRHGADARYHSDTADSGPSLLAESWMHEGFSEVMLLVGVVDVST